MNGWMDSWVGGKYLNSRWREGPANPLLHSPGVKEFGAIQCKAQSAHIKKDAGLKVRLWVFVWSFNAYSGTWVSCHCPKRCMFRLITGCCDGLVTCPGCFLYLLPKCAGIGCSRQIRVADCLNSEKIFMSYVFASESLCLSEEHFHGNHGVCDVVWWLFSTAGLI